MEDQPIRRSRSLQDLPPAITVEPPPPPQWHRLSVDGYFEPIGISEDPGKLKLRTNQVDSTAVEIEDLQADEFAKKL